MTTAPESGEAGAHRSTTLVRLARTAIECALAGSGRPDPEGDSPEALWLTEPGATFVTLKLDGRLRGCIGSLQATRSLREDVVDNAVAAAFEDSRFPALAVDEFEGLTVEVSVLSQPEPIECGTETELLARLRPGIDGLVLEYGHHRATYLPQVWESLPKPEAFLRSLKLKARLDGDFWSDEMRFSRYTVEKHQEA